MKVIGKNNVLLQLAILVGVVAIMFFKTGFIIVLAIPLAIFVAGLANTPIFHISQTHFAVNSLMPFTNNIDVLLANVHKIDINADYTLRVDVHLKDGTTLSKTVSYYKRNLDELREALQSTGVPFMITGKRA